MTKEIDKMDWQLPITVFVVLVAAAYVARMTWRAWFSSKASGCGGGCGCAAKSADRKSKPILIPSDQIKVRVDR
jgi:hypothetical protein